MSERRFRRDLVLADASPLIALSIVQGFDWLRTLLGKITTTSVILQEVASGQGRCGEQEILQAVRRRRIEVVVDEHTEPAFDDLDADEASILRLAVHSRRHCLI